jgi:AcrR family transcriptional regulator
MSRKKEYIEEEVIEKAMYLFWLKGYDNTSLQMLEREMGINKFSIYASFGSKNGLFIESLKLYRQKVDLITKELETASDGVLAIKRYFYNFLKLTAGKGFGKGCFITNTLSEIDTQTDKKIVKEVEGFREDIKHLFFNKLMQLNTKNIKIVEGQADYLLISMIGLSSASRICKEDQLENYIENTFNRL